MATINGTFNSLIGGTISGTVGTPGPQGPAGPAGAQGIPGPGVPVGGTAGQFLTKTTTGVDYATNWSTLSLAGYATESWVTAGFYPLTGNPSGFLTASALTPYLTKADNLGSLTNFGTARDNLGLGTLNSPTFAALTLQGSGANAGQYTPTSLTLTHATFGSFVISPSSGITFPDSTVQSTAFTTAQLSAYLAKASNLSDLPSASSARTNLGLGSLAVVNDAPSDGSQYARKNGAWDVVAAGADFISSVSSPLSVTSGNLTIDLSAYAQLSGATFTGNVFAPTPSPGTDSTRIATTEWVKDFDYAPLNSPQFNGNPRGPTPSLSDDDTSLATTAFVKGQNYLTSSALSGYALLSGATFSGKVNLASLGVGFPSFNLGGQCDPAPASAANGDLWISNAAAPKITYRTGGINYNLAVLNQFNTFTGQMVINTTSSVAAALRVTQLGTANAIEVEDSTSPDSTRFVVDQHGRVGIGIAPDTTAALKVDIGGIMFADGTRQTTIPIVPLNQNVVWLAQNYFSTVTSWSYDSLTNETTVNHSSGVVDAITAGIDPMSGDYMNLVDYADPYTGFQSSSVSYGAGYIVFSGDLNSKNLFLRMMPSEYSLPGLQKAF
jgi:hypothetical protein